MTLGLQVVNTVWTINVVLGQDLAYLINYCQDSRVSELNHFGGIASFFPRLGTRDTDRWRINKGLFATCQCPQCPISEKRCNCPEVI